MKGPFPCGNLTVCVAPQARALVAHLKDGTIHVLNLHNLQQPWMTRVTRENDGTSRLRILHAEATGVPLVNYYGTHAEIDALHRAIVEGTVE